MGNIEDVKENNKLATESDPYFFEPERNPGLVVNNAKPFNAETPLEILDKHFYTPNEWFYIRNHLPTPDVTAEEYELDVAFDDGKDEKTLNLSDLKTKFQKVEITSTIQCGGNRRAEMNEIKPIKGLMWKGGAIGNAKWGGVRLSDILQDYNLTGIRNVKWLRRIVLSEEESHSHWQRSDYKGFNPSVDWSNVDFTKSPSVQNMPVTSVICSSKIESG